LRGQVTFPKGTVLAIVLVLVARSVVLLIIPWPLKLIIDSVITHKPLWHWLAPFLPDPAAGRLRLLNVLGISLLVLGAAENALSYHGDRLLLIAGQHAVFQLRIKVFAHLQRLSLAFHRRQRIGDLMSKLGGDINTLQDFVVNVGSGVFAHLLTVVGMAAVLLEIDWRYAIVVMVSVPPLLWVTQTYATRVKASLRRARKKESEVWSMVQEILGAIHVVQAYGREAAEEQRFTERVEESLRVTLEATSLQLQLPRIVGSVFATATAVTLWFGAVEALKGLITAGELLVFLAYLRGMAAPVRQMAKTVSSIGKAEVAGERIAELLAQTTEVREAEHPQSPAVCTGGLEFRSVCFGYSPDREILTDLSFRIPAGRTVALVGPTGAGKSTIASLIPRFYDPTRGQILLDGVDVRELSLACLRSHVALVTQEPVLLSGPIWQNIAYGRPHADRAAAIAAAQAVGIHDLIQALPAGYDTVIGERGATLSGGQRQFIAVARAMVRNAPIVILDEPTSSLDAVTEFRLGAALRRLTAGRTTLVIAHRLTTIAAADVIFVIDAGRMVQEGTHGQLLREGGRYAEFWHQGGNVLRGALAREGGSVA
jgi:ATP-binding cassette subfamily B protein/subfamily B ATP-binding cassette protein MsbA